MGVFDFPGARTNRGPKALVSANVSSCDMMISFNYFETLK